MGKKKTNYRDTARELKRLGLVNYDLRRELSRGQKSQIEKLRKEWGHALKNPDAFHKARVSKDTAKELKAAGFKVTPKGVAFVPLHEHSSASIQKNRIVFKSPNGATETTFLVDHKKWFGQLRSLMAEKLPRNRMITVRIGDRKPFQSAFTNYAALFHYLDNEFEPNDPGESKGHLFSLMSVVDVPRTAQKRKAPAKKTLSTKEGWKIDPETGEILKPHAKKKAPAKKKRGS